MQENPPCAGDVAEGKTFSSIIQSCPGLSLCRVSNSHMTVVCHSSLRTFFFTMEDSSPLEDVFAMVPPGVGPVYSSSSCVTVIDDGQNYYPEG
ncbi:hypothetical protein GDO81_020753 [Engystomops pustulosus]|uniref:Uncharacterized protein n=1 Tax=Engystomops pustulosus TaxID=76066 RepID=A0AAV6YWH9_ENGPU|nr:hypothetical protein GDO81_020753 [Engystomops pustulosus]